MKYKVFIEYHVEYENGEANGVRTYDCDNCGNGFSYEEAEAWAEGLRILDKKGILNYHLTVIKIEEMGA